MYTLETNNIIFSICLSCGGTMASCLSLIPLYRGYLRRRFKLSGLSFQNVQIDPETEIYFWGPPPGLLTGKPSVVLLQGFGPDSTWQWQNQVPFLAPHFDLYIPHLLFLGESKTTSQDRRDVFQAACVVKLLEKIRVEKYSVVGHSYGSFVAYHMARLWPERVEKVTIASCALNFLLNQDYLDLLELTGTETICDLVLPSTPQKLKLLMAITMKKQLSRIPNFIIKDAFYVSFVSPPLILFHKRIYVKYAYYGNEFSKCWYISQDIFANDIEERRELLNCITLGQEESSRVSPLLQEVLILWGQNDELFRLEKAFQLKEYDIGKRGSLGSNKERGAHDSS
ncbi:hypothetical protein GIB67_020599 [Kingdonia uniflora]|uniref:AB hydrolase-1 domain-containing protein n=1 Tax=Kingdonia uniflora TaxID=39325 RepID=A0A7J7M8Q3_9MAGN|nr:hypothetical protein GIB67_020599 [Kingdonia uniflora]